MAALSAPGIPPTQPLTVKLRGSCHACALSKLKCSQDKPTCARCAKRGTNCQYLASKRAGRKQGSRTSNLKTPTKADFQNMDVDEDDDGKDFFKASSHLMQYALQQDRNLDTYRDIHHHQRTPSYPESVPSLLSSAGPATSATTPLTFGHPEFDGFLASPGSLSLLETPDIDYLSGIEVNFRGINGFPDSSSFFPNDEPMPIFEDDPLKLPLVASPNPSEPNLASSPFTPQIPNNSTSKQCVCLSRSLALFRELFPSPSLDCTTKATEDVETASLPTVQQVITRNEKTIEGINQVLQCACSQDGYTLAVLTLAVFKVLAWYRAVAQVCPAFEDNQAAEQVDQAPAIIGGYHLEGDDRNRMALQLVLGELHRVQQLVNTLLRRLKDRGSQAAALVGPSGDSISGHAAILPLHLFDELAVDLGVRLRGLSGEIVDRLRRG